MDFKLPKPTLSPTAGDPQPYQISYSEDWQPAYLDATEGVQALIPSEAGLRSLNTVTTDGTLREAWAVGQKPIQINEGDVMVLNGDTIEVLPKTVAEERVEFIDLTEMST